MTKQRRESAAGASRWEAPAAGSSKPAKDLAKASAQLLDGGQRPLDAAALRDALLDLHEFWLTTKATDIGITATSGFAIVATGGLGRRELVPYSDLDLMLLHDNMPDEVVTQVAELLWYPLWDANIRLDHSVRTVPEALQVAGEDIAAGMAMLEARHIAGDAELSSLLVGGARRQWRTGIVSRFDAIGAMHAHAHLGVVGFFVMLIVGVSYRLIPMFTLTEVQSKRRAALSILLLNIGLAGSVVTILLRSPLKIAFTVIAVSGLALFGWELHAMLRARKRPVLDWGLKSFLVAVTLLIPVCLLALLVSWPTLPMNQFFGMLENVYGFLGLFGVVALAILGMLHKILPFLVWFGVYSPHVGRAQLPLTSQMVSERAQASGLVAYFAGLLVISIAILHESELWVRVGGVLLLASLVMFGFNAIKVFSHFRKPQLRPLPTTKPAVV